MRRGISKGERGFRLVQEIGRKTARIRKLSVPLVAGFLLLAGCGSDGSTDEADKSPATDAPSLTPGAVSEGQVTIEGTVIDYVAVTPDGFEVGDTAPVLLALPPGSQDRSLTQRVTSGTYATEAIARGWVAISPAAPNGQLYFQGSEELIPGLLDWVETWVTPEGGRPHLAGISNGGISSFRVAAQQPDRFGSVVVFPGFPRGDEDRAALELLTGIPVRMFVGENDGNWVTPMEQTLATLEELGGDVALEIREGEGHVMASLSDGVEIFDHLDAARS